MAEPDRHQPTMTIRQLRLALGWSQRVLAGRLRLAESAVSDWERGRRVPTPGQQQALADLFGVPVEAIAFGPAEQAPQDRP